MRNKQLIMILLMSIMLVGSVSALSVNYFYSPSCPHCNEVKPLVLDLFNKFSWHKYQLIDVTTHSVNISGVPTIRIKTDDCREIELVGSYEIPKYLKCELQEQSTKECMTHSELKRGSYFIE